MICALTVRTLKPGTFDEFREAFLAGMDPESPPAGWVRFDMLRNAENRDEAEMGYDEQMRRIAPFVSSSGTSGIYEVVADYAAA